MPFSAVELQKSLNQHGACDKYWVAYSGGLDSTVLLHAILQLEAKVAAVHVNHGLYADADHWAEHCRQVCQSWGVEFYLHKVDARAHNSESPEAAARDARYQALKSYITENSALLTAHHQDDQVETLLLQLFRGAGVQGLASMPTSSVFAQGLHIRPILSASQQALRDYAQACRLKWLEDHSNADERFDRNFVRHQLMPQIRSRWPSIGKVVSRAAALQGEAAGLLAELAQIDLNNDQAPVQSRLAVSQLTAFSPARQRNMLRYWIRAHSMKLPSQAVIEEILSMLEAAPDRMPCVHWGGQQIRRYRDHLYLFSSHLPAACTQPIDWNLGDEVLISSLGVVLRKEDLPLDLSRYLSNIEQVTIRFRQGGERLRLPGRTHHHRLKQLLQEQGVPPWLRDRLPLVYVEDRLIAVLGLDEPILVAEVYG